MVRGPVEDAGMCLHAYACVSWLFPLSYRQRVDLGRSLRQWVRPPALSPISRAEHLSIAGRTVEVAWVSGIDIHTKHGAVGLGTQIHFVPGVSAILAAEQCSHVAAKACSRCHIQGLGVVRRDVNIPAIRPAGREGLQRYILPMIAPVGATKHPYA